MGHAGKLFALGLGQVRAVDNPVVVNTTVETVLVLLARAVGNHLSRRVLFAWSGWVFLPIVLSLANAAAFSAAAAATAAALPFCVKAMPPPCSPPSGWRCW